MSFNELGLNSYKVPIPTRGPTRSEDMRDFINHTVTDLQTIAELWNDQLHIVIDTLPQGSTTVAESERVNYPNPFVNGLDGANVYVNNNAKATDSLKDLLYNTLNLRPQTIEESLQTVFNRVLTLEQDGEETTTTTSDTYQEFTDQILVPLESVDPTAESYPFALRVNNVSRINNVILPSSYPGVGVFRPDSDKRVGYPHSERYIDVNLSTPKMDGTLSPDDYVTITPSAVDEWAFVAADNTSSFPGYQSGDILVWLAGNPFSGEFDDENEAVEWYQNFKSLKVPTGISYTDVLPESIQIWVNGTKLISQKDFIVPIDSPSFSQSLDDAFVVIDSDALSPDFANDYIRVSFSANPDYTNTVTPVI